MTHPIVFLSDFGYRNEWVGICHAVLNRIALQSHIIDLSHGIPPLDPPAGACCWQTRSASSVTTPSSSPSWT